MRHLLTDFESLAVVDVSEKLVQVRAVAGNLLRMWRKVRAVEVLDPSLDTAILEIDVPGWS